MDLEREDELNIAVLSGKGGTGKATVSINLALVLGGNYIDCDVEEPNGFIFLKPEVEEAKSVMVEYPFIDNTKCNSCGESVKVYQFNALAKIKDDIMLFQKLCHSCGACEIVCKYDALSYKKIEIGKIEKGKTDKISCSGGILNIGEPMAVLVIKELLQNLSEETNLIDGSPGIECSVISSITGSDAVLIVTEPTISGFENFMRVVSLCKYFRIFTMVCINKYDINEDLSKKIENFIKKEKLLLVGRIPLLKSKLLMF